LILDEPTDLPEGQVVELLPVSGLDDLDDAERALLLRELEASTDEADAGRVISAEEMLAELRAIR
jgi:hypothetical protein